MGKGGARGVGREGKEVERELAQRGFGESIAKEFQLGCHVMYQKPPGRGTIGETRVKGKERPRGKGKRTM